MDFGAGIRFDIDVIQVTFLYCISSLMNKTMFSISLLVSFLFLCGNRVGGSILFLRKSISSGLMAGNQPLLQQKASVIWEVGDGYRYYRLAEVSRTNIISSCVIMCWCMQLYIKQVVGKYGTFFAKSFKVILILNTSKL